MQLMAEALPEVLKLWRSVLPSMLLGCFLGYLFQDAAFLRRLGKVLRPLARLGHLPPGCTACLALSLADRVAAYTMLAGLRRAGVVGAREVLITFLASALPTGLYFTAFFIAPAVIPSLGWGAGSLYLAIYLGVNLCVAGVGLLLGRRLLPPPGSAGETPEKEEKRPGRSFRERVVGATLKSIPAFLRLAAVFVPVTLGVAALLHLDTCSRLLGEAGAFLRYLGLPPAVLIVVTTGVVSSVAAIGAVGPIFRAGLVTPAQAVAVLLFASLLHYLYDFWSSGLPTNIAIFGPRLGGKVSFVALIVRECATCLALGCIVLLF